jgi:hypothetical protein
MERVWGRVHQSWASIREPIEWSVWEGGAGINQRADRMERVWERVCINHRYQSESRLNGACVGESVHQSWVSIREQIEWMIGLRTASIVGINLERADQMERVWEEGASIVGINERAD